MLPRTRSAIALAGAVSLLTVAHAQAASPQSFSAPIPLKGASGGEPMIATDGKGNVIVSAPQGLGGGEGAYWVSHDHGATFPATPQILGGPSGGGDEDEAFAPNDGTQYAGRVYLADLAATYSTTCFSTDHGDTWAAVGPLPDPQACKSTPLGQVGPSSDRQWLTTDKNGRAYMTYHEFVSAQPLVFTTANGGADGFANPCGNVVSDPTIEVNVPQDITGGTLMSKPVVDSAGNLYVLFTTTTQQQNIAGLPGSIAGTFSQVYLAISSDHCTSFTDYTVYDGASTHAANTVQFGDIFNDIAIDPAGNLYIVAAGYIGSTAFATTTDVYMFTSPASSHGTKWNPPVKVTTDGGAHMLPAITTGLAGGQVALGYYRTTNGVTNPNDTTGTWTYTTAETNDGTDAAPVFTYADIQPGTTWHKGDICNSGILCGTGLPGTGSDRSLADYTSATTDSDGCPLFTWTASNTTANPTAQSYVAKQVTGCFAGLAVVVGEAPLAGGILVAGLAATAVYFARRRRGASAR